jgi:hypothetical protein
MLIFCNVSVGLHHDNKGRQQIAPTFNGFGTGPALFTAQQNVQRVATHLVDEGVWDLVRRAHRTAQHHLHHCRSMRPNRAHDGVHCRPQNLLQQVAAVQHWSAAVQDWSCRHGQFVFALFLCVLGIYTAANDGKKTFFFLLPMR